MTQYMQLDDLILHAIRNGQSPLYARYVVAEASLIAHITDRECFRVIDGRLQALRKSGQIRHMTKAQNNGKRGWCVVDSGRD